VLLVLVPTAGMPVKEIKLLPGSILDPAEPGRDEPGEAEEGAGPVLLVLVVGHNVPGRGQLVNVVLSCGSAEDPLVLPLQRLIGLFKVSARLVSV
jgi:hypothetical protein